MKAALDYFLSKAGIKEAETAAAEMGDTPPSPHPPTPAEEHILEIQTRAEAQSKSLHLKDIKAPPTAPPPPLPTPQKTVMNREARQQRAESRGEACEDSSYCEERRSL